MAELQPPDGSIFADLPPSTAIATTSTAPQPQPQPPSLPTEIPTNISNPAAAVNQGPGLATKRQRRPSVRLGEIGDQSFDHSHGNSRRPKAWRFHKDPSFAAKTSKIRPLTNLVNSGGELGFDLGAKRVKSKRPTKRARTNWTSSSSYAAAKSETAASNGGGVGIIENEGIFRNEENHENDDFREFDAEGGSDSPLREQSPVNSAENRNMGLQFWDRRAMRSRLSHSESLDRQDNVNMNNNVNGIHNEMNSGEENRSRDGVRDWLIGLGLWRYAPVFEIHEVDDEVLPMLTLEDLKDMGINAVGSRRKMYNAILKMRKGFS